MSIVSKATGVSGVDPSPLLGSSSKNAKVSAVAEGQIFIPWNRRLPRISSLTALIPLPLAMAMLKFFALIGRISSRINQPLALATRKLAAKPRGLGGELRALQAEINNYHENSGAVPPETRKYISELIDTLCEEVISFELAPRTIVQTRGRIIDLKGREFGVKLRSQLIPKTQTRFETKLLDGIRDDINTYFPEN